MIIFPTLKLRDGVNKTSTPKCPQKPKCICITAATGAEIADTCEFYSVDLDTGELIEKCGAI